MVTVSTNAGLHSRVKTEEFKTKKTSENFVRTSRKLLIVSVVVVI